MNSWLVNYFLCTKAEVVTDEAERTSATRLDLRGLQLAKLPEKLTKQNPTFEKKLLRLLLGRNKLSSLAFEYFILPELRTLSLAHNSFTNLPQSLILLENLTRLNLSHNDFSTGFPLVVCTLKNLTVLWATGAQINSLPSEINQLKSLKDLGLRLNFLSVFTPEIGHFESLNRLFLSGNLISSLPAFPPNSSLNTTLVYLNLDDNNFSELPQAFFQFHELRYLSMKRNLLLVTLELIMDLRKISNLIWCRLQGNSRDHPMQIQSNMVFRPRKDNVSSSLSGLQTTDETEGDSIIDQTGNPEERDLYFINEEGETRMNREQAESSIPETQSLVLDQSLISTLNNNTSTSSTSTTFQSPWETNEEIEVAHHNDEDNPHPLPRWLSELTLVRVENWLVEIQAQVDANGNDNLETNNTIAMAEEDNDNENEWSTQSRSNYSIPIEDDNLFPEDSSEERVLFEIDLKELEDSPTSTDIEDNDNASTLSDFPQLPALDIECIFGNVRSLL